VLAQGVNNGSANPILHGEIVAINDYVARHGNRGRRSGLFSEVIYPEPQRSSLTRCWRERDSNSGPAFEFV
jgi:hypothetical protein